MPPYHGARWQRLWSIRYLSTLRSTRIIKHHGRFPLFHNLSGNTLLFPVQPSPLLSVLTQQRKRKKNKTTPAADSHQFQDVLSDLLSVPSLITVASTQPNISIACPPPSISLYFLLPPTFVDEEGDTKPPITICAACLATACLNPPWRFGVCRATNVSTTAAPMAAAAICPPFFPIHGDGSSRMLSAASAPASSA